MFDVTGVGFGTEWDVKYGWTANGCVDSDSPGLTTAITMAPNILSSTALLPPAVVALLFLIVIAGARYLFVLRAKRAPATPQPPHILQFPPSRRHTLASFSQTEKLSLLQHEASPQTLKERAVASYRAANHLTQNNFHTPTGISTQEIRALGRFPDYSILSGVPHPEPTSSKWDISKAVFRPFRPFRWNYHQHMALMKYDPNWWIELEQNYTRTMSARQALLKKHNSQIFFQSPSPLAELAARELSEMLLQFLCRRYPQHFSLSADNSLFHNNLLNTTTNLLTTPPLRAIFDNVPEDYAIMLRNEDDGYYYLRAAAVCSSVGWHITQHRDAPMKKIHTHVPDADKMQFSLDRWFSKLPTETPVMRASWSIEDWEAMFTSPEIEPEVEWHRSAFSHMPEKLTEKDLKLRCDAQTLRRLPLSGAVVFNFKAVFTPFEELRDEPFIPALLHKVLAEGKRNLIDYKCDPNVRRVAMDALGKWAAEQVAAGVVPADWEVSTLDQSPFYPGWEEKWKKRQGLE